MGLSVSEVMNMTPRRFNRLMVEYNNVLKRSDKWNAVLASVIANGYAKNPVKPEDFLPTEKKVMTPEEMLAVVKQFVT